MASGSFRTPTCTAAGSGYYRYIEVIWSSTNDTKNNKSTINWTAYGRSPDSSTSSHVMSAPITIKINGTTVLSLSERFRLKKDQNIGSGTVEVSHDSDGTKSVNVSIDAAIYTYAVNNTYSGTITMTANPVYSLGITPGSGSSIVVNRTYCAGFGSTGTLSAGENLLCNGDILKITFSADTNYKLSSTKVNSSSFASGNTHTVSGNVTVVSTAQVLASSVGATSADIGSVSTITITKYNASYYHTLQYTFGELSGYITNSGGTSTTPSKFSNSSVAFTVPSTFYAQIPNAKTGTCTITCKTYSDNSSTTQLGDATTCSFTVTATGGPSVSGTVIDTNATTVALTGDSSILIKHKSTAVATIDATANNYSSISSKLINDNVPTDNKITFPSVFAASFSFTATDSRGYSATKKIYPTMVEYIQLTLNSEVYRPSPTGGEMAMKISGNYYRGSFGAYSNTLTIKYRYREASSSNWIQNWETLSTLDYTVNASSYSSSVITIGTDFDYRKEYVFEVQASDGTSDYPLTTVKNAINVQRGLPVFDWGENDFNFNVPIVIGSGTAGEENGVCKKFTNGIWVGNDVPQNETGVFSPKQGYNGIFIDTTKAKTYVVEGTSMRELYTGDTIAKFG